MSKRLWPWPEPRGHALLKLGLSYLYRDEHARAESAFLRALDLFEVDSWGRWTWYIPLVRARGELALAERRLEDAWRFASEAFDLAARSGRSKHMARAQRVQGEVLAAGGRLDEAVRMLEGSVRIAEAIKAPREAWLGEAALGGVLARLGRDRDAETMLTRAVDTIESMTVNLTTPTLRRSFLAAEPVTSVYRTLGRRPPENTPRQ